MKRVGQLLKYRYYAQNPTECIRNVGMKRIHAALLVLAGIWLAVVLWVVLSDVILRETRLGVVAQQLDRLPSRVATVLFMLLWVIFLFGWAIPAGFGLMPLLRRRINERNAHQ